MSTSSAIHTPDLDDVFLALTGRHSESDQPENDEEDNK